MMTQVSVSEKCLISDGSRVGGKYFNDDKHSVELEEFNDGKYLHSVRLSSGSNFNLA